MPAPSYSTMNDATEQPQPSAGKWRALGIGVLGQGTQTVLCIGRPDLNATRARNSMFADSQMDSQMVVDSFVKFLHDGFWRCILLGTETSLLGTELQEPTNCVREGDWGLMAFVACFAPSASE